MPASRSDHLRKTNKLKIFGFAIPALIVAGNAFAENSYPASTNINSATGLIDMPSGEAQPDGQLSTTISHFAGITRTTLSFQITPRLSGSFRYTGIQEWNFDGFDTFFDRSFDLRYNLLNEGPFLPSVTFGLQDIAGTGLFSGEYIAATKHMLPNLKITGGIGWGRLGSYGAVGSPFGNRPMVVIGQGGKVNANVWFRGPAAPFGGVEWQATDRLTLKAEYSSDNYDLEAGARNVFERKSPFNFGIEYRLNNSVHLGAYSLYGSELGVRATISFNPNKPPAKGSLGPAPLPVKVRPNRKADPESWSPEWVEQPNVSTILRQNLTKQLAAEGLVLEALTVTGHTAELRFYNPKYDANAQAIGRAARALTRSMPASIEIFRIIPMVNGIPASSVSLKRTDIEAHEHSPAGAAKILARATISDAGNLSTNNDAKGLYPRFDWSFAPYVRASLFDPDNPLRGDIGLRLKARYNLAPGLVLSGSAIKKLAGNLDGSTRISDSVLPHVRSDFAIYDKLGDPALESLKLDYYFRPGRNLYGKVSAGYLERMYGGASAEILWKQVSSPLAIGAELGYVTQRDFDLQFGFQEYNTVTGHISGYYQFGDGFHAQVDVGRYLAGDWGTTLSLNREFANGWKVGAYATFTDVSSAEFGEGSFDKGIRLEIPISWFMGRPSRNSYFLNIRPVTRDGGARLNLEGRLYNQVRGYHRYGLESQWGRFWR